VKGGNVGAYEEWKMLDILSPIIGKLQINITPEGQPKIYLRWEGAANSPWICNIKATDRTCALWSNNYFKYYGLIPRGCRSCWKVVMEVPTVKQLMNIEKYQTECEYGSKCGIETRPETGKLGKYGAYWYAPLAEGLAGGRKMHKWLQKKFPGVKLVLKRGCTEMEAKWNPSDKWDEYAEKLRWDFYEELLNTLFVLEEVPFGITPSMFKPVIRARWVEWAFEHGDATYLDFVDAPFKREYLSYQSSIHNEKDFIGSVFEPVRVKGNVNYGTNLKWGTEEAGNHNRSNELAKEQKEPSESSGEEASRLTLLS